jgi:hypothetical protein
MIIMIVTLTSGRRHSYFDAKNVNIFSGIPIVRLHVSVSRLQRCVGDENARRNAPLCDCDAGRRSALDFLIANRRCPML